MCTSISIKSAQSPLKCGDFCFPVLMFEDLPVIHCRDWNVMFLTPCFASLPTGLKFMDSFRPQCDFFICFHNDTVSFLCYEKSVSEKYSCGQIRMITYLRLFSIYKTRAGSSNLALPAQSLS